MLTCFIVHTFLGLLFAQCSLRYTNCPPRRVKSSRLKAVGTHHRNLLEPTQPFFFYINRHPSNLKPLAKRPLCTSANCQSHMRSGGCVVTTHKNWWCCVQFVGQLVTSKFIEESLRVRRWLTAFFFCLILPASKEAH